MKIYDTKRNNRISLLSKHLSPSTKKRYSRRKLSNNYLSNSPKKSRYHSQQHHHHQYRSCKYNKINNNNNKQRKEEEAYLIKKLKKEAYADLHTQLQHYNDEFIAHMRYMENNDSNETLPSSFSTDSLCSTNTEESTSLQNLIELFETSSVKDYSKLIEWESNKNPPTYFECQGEYGDLW